MDSPGISQAVAFASGSFSGPFAAVAHAKPVSNPNGGPRMTRIAQQNAGASRLTSLVQAWRIEAATLRSRYADESGARLCEVHAEELHDAVTRMDNELLSLSEAASESGYSTSHLRSMIATGELANAGRKGRPRIQRAALPRRDKMGGALGQRQVRRRSRVDLLADRAFDRAGP
jgi:hypothetical protein